MLEAPFIESPFIAELLATAERRAWLAGYSRALVCALGHLHGELPEELVVAIHTCVDATQLRQWLETALEVNKLSRFRKQTGI
jgi:hypothetical protein